MFKDSSPKLSIYGLEGILLELSGRTVTPAGTEIDLISTYSFFVEQTQNAWRFGCRSNIEFLGENKRIFNNILDKANKAIAQRHSTDLSQEFNALHKIDPYDIVGLFTQMNERYGPIDKHHGGESMREKLRNSATSEEIQADQHLKRFIENSPTSIISIDGTITEID